MANEARTQLAGTAFCACQTIYLMVLGDLQDHTPVELVWEGASRAVLGSALETCGAGIQPGQAACWAYLPQYTRTPGLGNHFYYRFFLFKTNIVG